MARPAPLDNPRTGQFHGGVVNRRPLESAIMVKTEPDENAQANKAMHYHQNAFFWMLLEGDCMEYIEGGIERVYAPMVLTYHPAGEMHAHRAGKRAPSGFGIVLMDPILDRVREFTHFLEEPKVLDGQEFLALAHRIRREFEEPDPSSALALEGLTLELLAQTARAPIAKPDTAAPRWLIQARDLIHARFTENLKMSEIAAAVGIHPVHLGAEFRRHFGCTAGECLRKLRVECAASRLTKQDASIAEIAILCGFYDESHFCRTFKAQTGLTPSEYRVRS